MDIGHLAPQPNPWEKTELLARLHLHPLGQGKHSCQEGEKDWTESDDRERSLLLFVYYCIVLCNEQHCSMHSSIHKIHGDAQYLKK